MRGIDYFPNPDEGEWRRSYDRRAVQLEAAAGPGGITRATYDQLYITICNENEYNAWRRRLDRTAQQESVLWDGIPVLDVKALEEKSFGRPSLAPFKLTYDTLEEVRMRFAKTVILIKGHPFYVTDQRRVKTDFFLLLDDALGQKSAVGLNDVPDFRSPPAGYVQFEGTNGYMTRNPARVNTQGLSNQNVMIQKIGLKSAVSFNQPMLVSALASRGKLLPWNEHYLKLIQDKVVPEFRLSDTTALYTAKKSDDILVEYKGRRFGKLENNIVTAFDEDDLIQPWVAADMEAVNLEVKS